MANVRFEDLLKYTQNHIANNYSGALSEKDKHVQLRSYISNYLRTNDYSVEGYNMQELTDALYMEMVEYSFLTPYLTRDDVEEININGWDDIAITYSNGHIEKIRNFLNPQHAIDIIKRLLQHSDMIIDDAMPMAQGHLPNNTRITALKTPLIDEDRGIAASIRLLHSAHITHDELVNNDSITEEMFEFLTMCLRHGVSFMIAGATSSGKTTLLNALLGTIPQEKRIFTIESGARELSLVRRGADGEVCNNVVHTLARPSENERQDINQEDLVIAALRFNPDVVVVGEMRDIEAYSAVEAALTGHTVVSTIHAFAADAAHVRLALLTQKRFQIDFKLSLMQAAQAFPLIIYEHKLENNARKIMDICECIVDMEGNRRYQSLFRYTITKNEIIDNQFHIEGHFERCGTMSKNLMQKLINAGAPMEQLVKFAPLGADSNG